MPEQLEFASDFWRKRAEEVRKLAELIEDRFISETLLVAERAERLLRRK